MASISPPLRRENRTRDDGLHARTGPNVCFGKPCIQGHRIWVSLVLDLLRSGWTVQQLLEQYPGIEEADVLACIVYGAGRRPRLDEDDVRPSGA